MSPTTETIRSLKKALPFDLRPDMGRRRQQQFDLAKGKTLRNYRLHILPYQEDWGFSA